ncbi:NAD(P)-binding protein [Paraburkholderia caribensis]|uniref:NAD(P)-binding protein n=1 Tax=Paraburkholderia caribensis TaxID=75105 RepID=UPI001CC6E032
MITTDVAIVGGSLSGLYAASELESQGIEYSIIDVCDRTGGWTLSCLYPDSKVDIEAHDIARFALGASYQSSKELISSLFARVDLSHSHPRDDLRPGRRH